MKGTLNEINDLLARMEKVPNGGSGYIVEMMQEGSYRWRDVAGPDDFYDIQQDIAEGKFVTFGYVNTASVVTPKGKRINPLTNKPNQYNDYATLGKTLGVEEDKELVNIIKLTVYNMRWQSRNKVKDAYKVYKQQRDEIGSKYGVTFGGSRYDKTTIDYGKNGISAYGGDNEDKVGNTYTELNMYNVKPLETKYYLVLSDGSLREIAKEKLEMKPYSKSTAIDRLLAAGATEADVEPLKTMSYRNFENSHILFFAATADGIPTVFINTRLSDKIEGITNVNKEELVKIAKERYNI